MELFAVNFFLLSGFVFICKLDDDISPLGSRNSQKFNNKKGNNYLYIFNFNHIKKEKVAFGRAKIPLYTK